MNYKETIFLPKTNFPMKAHLNLLEPKIIGFWMENKIYEKMLERRKNSPPFILHDGPPYANGNIHMGHALNKILKDIIVKYKSLSGYYSPFVPGWDCHGLPIELKVEEIRGREKKDVINFRRECRKYAEKYVEIQREEFIRLGILGDWNSPYLTMSYSYEAKIYKEFLKLLRKNFLYKKKKPVYWCTSCTTALAEAEVEYEDKVSPSIYVGFVAGEKMVEKFNLSPPSYVLIWTTTPWTIPGNLAIQVAPEVSYIWAQTERGNVLLAKELQKKFEEETGIKIEKILKEVKGRELEMLEVEHPLFPRKSIIVLSEFVNLEQGTGCVHTAPGHGEEDYEVGIRYGLDVLSPVDERGIFTEEAGEFKGEFVFDANEKIIDVLREKNLLFKRAEIHHSYPHCWRCKNPVIFRATEQWFVSILHNNLRNRLLEEIEKVEWIPPRGRLRIKGMIESRPDWCISRQRFWGVPIAVLKCKKCGEYLFEDAFFERVIEEFEKSGADVWYEKKAEEFSKGFSCRKCGGEDFEKEMDILDVWFDSGVSHAAVLEGSPNLRWPADLYLEGSDQHRGWFQSSLITSVITRERAPYRKVLTHGFVVDGEGRKMAKSLGNVISPQEIIEDYGSEIIRLWCAAEDYREDVRISHEILTRLVESYRKIRNTIRFMLGVLFDFKSFLSIDISSMSPLDRYAIITVKDFLKNIKRGYESYEFHIIYHATNNYCVNFLSAFYLDVLKDCLYCEGKNSHKRRSAQSAIYLILKNFLIALSPLLSFTCEEAWQYLRGIDENLPESVFLNDFPEASWEIEGEIRLKEDFEKLLEVRDAVLKELEKKRVDRLIGSSLEAMVSLSVPSNLWALMESYHSILPEIFIVSEVELRKSENSTLEVSVQRAQGKKCQRCWNYRRSVGENASFPDLCHRCVRVLSEKE